MRRLIEGQNDERGVVSVMVAVLMVVLLGFAALAIDVGLMYAEKAQLQNGADAAALAIAQDCAEEDGCSDPLDTAQDFANANANDGITTVLGTTVNSTAQTVTVTTGAKEAGREDSRISLYFANAIGIDSAEIGAQASAAWGTPSKGPVILPLAIAECKFDPDAPPFTIQLLNMDDGECGEVPGAFGWITDGSDECGLTVTAGSSEDAGIWLDVDTGADIPSVCGEADIDLLNDSTVLFPLYDVATGTGSSGKYYVKGFAAFHITGYKFPGHSWPDNSLCNKCMEGYFVEFVSLSNDFETGSTPDYGASVVRLTLGDDE